MIRKLLAKARGAASRRGLTIRPMTNARTGGYAGFSLGWGKQSAGELRGVITPVTHGEHTARFFVSNERDLIQKEHVRGRFYEPEELAIIARYFSGGTYVDVGANVGNHAVFAGTALGADRIIAFEPNPEAQALLEVNLALNGLAEKTTVHPLGLSDEDGAAQLAFTTNNLGAARIDHAVKDAGEAQGITLARGDKVLADRQVGFIKIDAEGHELAVLSGLAETLARCTPPIFAEIEESHRAKAMALLEELGYRKAEEFSRYPGLSNLVFLHSSSAKSPADEPSED